MAFVRVEQRHARLASTVRVEYVKGRDGDIPKGTVTVISNARRGTGRDRTDEATAIQWTLWGEQAENAAGYLGKGSRVNVVGRMRNDHYETEGRRVYGFEFTCEEIDYLDTRAEADARRARRENEAASSQMREPQGPRGDPAGPQRWIGPSGRGRLTPHVGRHFPRPASTGAPRHAKRPAPGPAPCQHPRRP